jgi:phage-related protein
MVTRRVGAEPLAVLRRAGRRFDAAERRKNYVATLVLSTVHTINGKTQKTPDAELALARKRQTELKS